jgi:hypothetical protein
MALKSWKKVGEDHYKLKDGSTGEVWVEQKSSMRPLVATAVRGPNAHRCGTVNIYTFYCRCYGNGNDLHPKAFTSRAEAHAHLMKHIKKSDG